MAQGKKSFIAYSDWKNIFDELPNEDAGALIKHIFAYVNDENPVSDSVLIRAVFANIKSTLKRDLDKWDNQLSQRSEAGKRSAEKRALTKLNENQTVVEIRRRNPTVNDSVSVSVNDNVNEIKKEKEKFAPPTISEVQDYFAEKGYSIEIAKKAHEYYAVADWKDSKGNQVKNWKQKMNSVWFKDEHKAKTEITNSPAKFVIKGVL